MAFGDFQDICEKAALPLCALVGHQEINGGVGIQTTCYARSIEVGNTLIFQVANDFIHILAMAMAVIMIIHVRSKFTAVGRKEITSFFYIYLLLTIISLILDAGVAAPASAAYPYLAAAQNGLVSALCTCLMINGFVGFQLYEDGTFLSIWLIRIASLVMFLIGGAISLLTFKNWGLSSQNPIGIFVVTYIVNAILLFVYVVSQIMLVLGTLEDRWPLGDIAFGIFFFTIGQIILYVFSDTICDSVSHYMDGLIFATLCNLLGVMMVYKYWDSITREDLEFSVGVKQHTWEVKELLPEQDKRGTIYQDSEYAPSMYQQPYGTRLSHYSVGR
ncbi:chitin synthase export chaperone [Dothidotthia symphoricarpi CBS 119687]|uniref:Chitin synthase export chaperone n=1 Tax=Dothidotthia symphoricarpi CBS 119687 TaxID=1392245 RepID=A0A6A6A7L3_9PLEO|nr:chitin synthase export chaperone [Dothidotthia symphoricarpi CBS 119687]KAF2126641.1 chitin synthase export chaperone [Dothidotthia symphoricarpi CBS 119687]